MQSKKHYWTQVLLVTTVVSCGLGFASGFGFQNLASKPPSPSSAFHKVEQALTERTQPTRETNGPLVVSDWVVDGKLLRLEGVPNPHPTRLWKQRSGPCHGILDVSKAAFWLLLLVAGAMIGSKLCKIKLA